MSLGHWHYGNPDNLEPETPAMRHYRRSKDRALAALEAGEITSREYREMRREAWETFVAQRELEAEDED